MIFEKETQAHFGDFKRLKGGVKWKCLLLIKDLCHNYILEYNKMAHVLEYTDIKLARKNTK